MWLVDQHWLQPEGSEEVRALRHEIESAVHLFWTTDLRDRHFIVERIHDERLLALNAG
jgi:hypothetical protein